jgi:hypothetical protein
MHSDMRGSGAFCDIVSCVFNVLGHYEHKRLSVKPGRKPSGGEIRSENVDMSSDKEGERPSRRKSKGSCLKLI